MTFKATVLATCASMLLCAVVPCVAQAWSQYQADAQHTGRSKYIGPAQSPGAIAWTRGTFVYDQRLNVAVVGNRLYLSGGAESNVTFELDATTGATTYSCTINEPFGSVAVDSNGRVYMTTYNGAAAVDFHPTFASVWSVASPAAQDMNILGLCLGVGKVFYTTYSGAQLVALNAYTGAQLWTFAFTGSVKVSPTLSVDGGLVYCGSDAGILYALNTDTGAVVWQYSTSGYEIDGSPSIGWNGSVYFGAWDYNFYALNGQTGQLLWHYQTGGAVESTPAIAADGTVYFTSNDGYLYAADGQTGSIKWSVYTSQPTTLNYPSPVVDAAGNIYYATQSGVLYVLEPTVGKVLWSAKLDSAVAASPALGPNGLLYVVTTAGTLFAFGTPTFN
jgi:outer membrane protein assembly factor BamB